MERTNEKVNGTEKHGHPDPKNAFYLVDAANGEKCLVREMDDAKLAGFRAGVAHVSKEKMKSVLVRLQLLLSPLDANMCIAMFEQALVQAALLMVLEYEQNRRANVAAELPA